MRYLVVDLLCGAAAAQSLVLNPSDWRRVLVMADQHRLAPQLHWRLRQAPEPSLVPDEVKLHLSGRYREAIAQSFLVRRDLAEAAGLLAREGIEVLALKGPYLAARTYSNLALRPVRDIDLLVRSGQASRAYEILRGAGAEPTNPKINGDALGAQSGRWPELSWPSGGTKIDLHDHLFHHDGVRVRTDLSDTKGFWDRTVILDVLGVPVRFPSPTDTLLNLIEHAVYADKFRNGPLIITDVAGLLQHAAIDWPLFHRLARDLDLVRGADLTFRLVQRYWPHLAPGLGGQAAATADQTTPDPTDLALLLMMRDTDIERELTVVESARGRGLAYLASTFAPSRQRLSAVEGVNKNAASAAYFMHWSRLLTERAPSLLRSAFEPDRRADARRVRQLSEWLS